MPFIILNNNRQVLVDNVKDSIMRLLVKKTCELGRKVTFQDMVSDPMMPPPNSYAYYFTSFDQAAGAALAKVRKEKLPMRTSEKVLEDSSGKSKEGQSDQSQDELSDEAQNETTEKPLVKSQDGLQEKPPKKCVGERALEEGKISRASREVKTDPEKRLQKTKWHGWYEFKG